MNRPHILLITADELRKDALSCYGNETIATPHLDQLAAECIQFHRAYTASPWCLPARCALLTGQLPHNSGAYSNFRRCELNKGIPNLFSELKQLGYQTSVHGKCHFAPVPYHLTRADVTLPYDEFRDFYVSLGIDHLDLQDDKQVSVWFYDDYAKELDQAGWLNAYRDATWNEQEFRKVFPFPCPENWHPDHWVGSKAVDYLNECDGGAPSFSWVSFSGPHYPFDAPQSWLDRVDMSRDVPRECKAGEFDSEDRIHHRSYHGDGRGIVDGAWTAPEHACKNYDEDYWRELRRSYYANVAQIDEQIGRVISAARRRCGDNLLIIFTADHGEMLGNHGLWGKGDCGYEDVLNVPLLVQYPFERQRQETDARVMLTDIMATCLNAAGAEQVQTDGEDFKALIDRGGYTYTLAEGEGFAAISDGRWKYIQVVKQGKEFYELFDLQQDPKEFDNIIARPEHASVVAEQRKQLANAFMAKLLA